MIIADEAHRCAGKVSSDYATVLDKDSLPSRHRLFMTATPRLYQTNLKRQAAVAGFELASMDDEAVFGPFCINSPLARRSLITPLLTDYQVVVVGVSDHRVSQMIHDRSLVEIEAVQSDARTLAVQIGLAKAVNDYDLKRVISFHSRVSHARNFASGFVELLDTIPRDKKPSGAITYSHASGVMPTSQRAQLLQALASLDSEDRYLMANARCLSEVDVPALDGVAFVDPKRSEIDIVQAVGRAIRLAPNKKVG